MLLFYSGYAEMAGGAGRSGGYGGRGVYDDLCRLAERPRSRLAGSFFFDPQDKSYQIVQSLYALGKRKPLGE